MQPASEKRTLNSLNGDSKWRKLKERVVFRNAFVGLRNDIVRRPDGEVIDFIVVENRDFSAAVCLDRDDNVILVNQYRYPWERFSWEIPSGLTESGETPEECAIREVQEETGYLVKRIKPLIRYHPTGLGSGWCNTFFAEVRGGNHQPSETHEILKVNAFTPAQVDNMILNGEIVHAATILGWTMIGSSLRNGS
jgi:8-oxo-dGTP pyrophosphatase MutT (NUDIX family)